MPLLKAIDLKVDLNQRKEKLIICGSFIESDDNTGLATHIESFKV